ncbi:MAG: WYL domain-containing protein, partial [SAR324 cluster bacterium]|nr:WYL domain-containing protein [SAR324 cluster bacterium]
RLISPYGFLYGNRHYLIAYDDGAKDIRKFILGNIEQVELSNEMFEVDSSFSLDEYAAKAFGLFHEEPFDVTWRFSPKAAADVKEFQFHPNQKIEDQSDGSVVVRFRAGGALEMCWHLYKWGEDVEVLEPKHLADKCNGYRRSWPGLP